MVFRLTYALYCDAASLFPSVRSPNTTELITLGCGLWWVSYHHFRETEMEGEKGDWLSKSSAWRRRTWVFETLEQIPSCLPDYPFPWWNVGTDSIARALFWPFCPVASLWIRAVFILPALSCINKSKPTLPATPLAQQKAGGPRVSPTPSPRSGSSLTCKVSSSWLTGWHEMMYSVLSSNGLQEMVVWERASCPVVSLRLGPREWG